MTDILAEIIAHKKTELARLDVQALRRAAELTPLPRDFRAAVSSPSTPSVDPSQVAKTGVRLIAELKRASPSKGMLAPDIDLVGNCRYLHG